MNYYIPNENNNRVICFHNGNGESGDSMRGDRQLEKYIERDGNAVKGVELLSEIAEMDSIVTVRRWQNTQEEALKVLKTIAIPLINTALILMGGGQVSIPDPVPVPVPVIP